MSLALFIALATLGVTALVVVLTRPLWRDGTGGLHRLQRAHRIALKQLERALRAGAIDAQLYAGQRQALSTRLTDALLAAGAPAAAAVAGSGRRTAILSVALTAALLVVGGYLYIGDPAAFDGSSHPAAALPTVAQMVDGLAGRLRSNPNDLQGWTLLGRSYLVMARYADAAHAYAQADRLSSGDPDIDANYAEALVLSDEQALTGQAAPLIERALAAAPANAQALWLGGLLAQARHDDALAMQRWSTLLAQQGLPDDFRSAVQQHLQALRATPAAVSPADDPVDQTSSTAQTAQARTGVQGSARTGNTIDGVHVRVDLSGALAARAPRTATVFIFGRAPGNSGGPPLAVRRLTVGALPTEVELTGADAIMTGGALNANAPLQLTARVTLHGGVSAQPGDLEGQALYSGDGKPVHVLIDHVVP